MSDSELSRLAYNVIRLCCMLVIISALYILKVNIYPENAYEIHLAVFQTELMLECVVYAFIILILEGFLIYRTVILNNTAIFNKK